MKRLIIFTILICSVCSLCLIGCGRKGENLNEGLRLTQEDLPVFKQKALAGDAEAAKRLWQHYDSVEGDVSEGERWKTLYYKLNKEGAAPSLTPNEGS